MRIDESKDWWLQRADLEDGDTIGAGGPYPQSFFGDRDPALGMLLSLMDSEFNHSTTALAAEIYLDASAALALCARYRGVRDEPRLGPVRRAIHHAHDSITAAAHISGSAANVAIVEYVVSSIVCNQMRQRLTPADMSTLDDVVTALSDERLVTSSE
jgi:hypothetical protein